MPKPLLLIGNRRYSSWSMRPWLFLRQMGVDFDTEMVPMGTPRFAERVLPLSPNSKVPVLLHQGEVIFDSLAICEYAIEHLCAGRGWPVDARARAVARCVVAEMHSAFVPLRSAMPMNLSREGAPLPSLSAEVNRDIDRVKALWRNARTRFGQDGEYLFGAFSVADAFFAPVVTRFRSYAVALDPVCRAYADAIEALPALREWRAAAALEHERMDATDQIGRG